MKESKKGRCRKCGKFYYIDEHHILPQATFGKKGETVPLCPNCHRHVHEYYKKRIKNIEDKAEVEEAWKVWLKKISIVVTCLLIVLSVAHFL